MKRFAFLAAVVALAAGLVVGLAAAAGTDTKVTVGSPSGPFSQNKQNEPAVAVLPTNPSVAAAGANEEVDMEACAAGNPTTCPFTPGVGVSGIYFSTSGGAGWTQPTYTGYTARTCLGPAACATLPPPTPAGPANAGIGPIGTLPNYVENGLVSDGDPALAFGPRAGANGTFSWSNGWRLYYANLTSNFSGLRSEQAFKGFEAAAVSRLDSGNFGSALAGTNSAWMNPVIVTKQNAALFSDKEAIWADNAATSNFFGNVYLCNAAFRGQEISPFALPEPIVFSRSTDGGSTWQTRQLSAATNNGQTQGRQDCTVRTDSQGVVYVFWQGGDIRTRQTAIFETRSFDGGATFERPHPVAFVNGCGVFDPNTGRLSMDGIAGARAGVGQFSVDVANGAPTGSDATDELVMVYCTGVTPTDTQPGPNEQSVVQYSTDQGGSWTVVGNAAAASDRPLFPAIAISPNGTDAYLDYDALLQPWQSTTANPRLMQGVVRHADVGAGGSIGAFGTLGRGGIGDTRGSSQNGLTAGFLGDYNQIAATRSGGVAVFNDVRNASDCPAIDTYREALATGSSATAPNVEADCPLTFGNTDIYGGAFSDPTP
jgi:hypothetical protein